MAIDPRISLAANGNLNIGSRFGQALNNLQQIDLLNQNRALQPLINQQNVVKSQALKQQFLVQTAQQLKPYLDSGNYEQAANVLQQLKQPAQQLGLDPNEIDQDILSLGTEQGRNQLTKEVNTLLTPASQQQISVSQREFQHNVDLVKNDPELKTPEAKAASIALGLTPRAVGSAQITTANTKGQTDIVGNSLADIQAKVQTATENAKTTGAIRTKVLKDATDFAKNASDKLAAIPETNRIYQSAIDQIDAGANTGQVYDLLPTIDTNSIVLENIANKAGFDLAKSGGGIITDADMKFGLATAIPRNLPPAELKDFLAKKIEIQNKIAENLYKAVEFLGDGKHTIPEWYKKQKKEANILAKYGIK